jgi:peptidoglycan/xylan/chitin deacetylase (PgdA/CDA1 family)
MTRELKRLVGGALFTARASTWLLRNAAVVVAFHRVRPEVAPDALTISPAQFERLCRFFKRSFDVVPLDDIVNRMHRRRPIGRALAITFDDGYQDNYRYAAPILEALSLPATFFVVSGWIGTGTVPWWDRRDAVAHAWMTWNELRSLSARHFEIGAHTRTHVDLGAVPGDEARREIAGARQELESRLGAPVTSFAYPYGRRDNITEATRKIVKDAGFRCCCAAFGGVNSATSDPFRLMRVPVNRDNSVPHELAFDVALGRTLLSA